MKIMKVSEVARILAEHPALGIKALEKPFVLVIKTKSGIVVTYQNESFQKTFSIGKAVFPENILIDAVIDIQLKKKQALYHFGGFQASRRRQNGLPNYWAVNIRRRGYYSVLSL